MCRGVPGARVAGLALAGLLAMRVQAAPLGAPAEAAKGDVLPLKAIEKTLANGLRVLIVPTGFPNIISVQIPVQTGSRNEVEPGKTGFAHFFEHMLTGPPTPSKRATSPPRAPRAACARGGSRT